MSFIQMTTCQTGIQTRSTQQQRITYRGTAISYTLKFSDEIEINAIVWIQSLLDVEQGPSRRIKEDLAAISTDGGFNFYDISVSTKSELLEALIHIEELAEKGLRPILHFDMHGAKEDGLLMAPSGEYMSWDGLADSIRKINIATKNNLCCVFATCFALRFARQTKIFEPTLFYLIIAPLEEVSVGFLEDQTNKFYHFIMTSGNITTAYNETLSGEMKLWNCQEIYAQSLVDYVKTYTKGSGAKQRLERLLTKHFQGISVNNPTSTQLRDARIFYKAKIKPDQSIIDQTAPVFLIGRHPGVSFEDLKPFFTADMQFGVDE